jgi:hypothetical protein
MTRATHDSDGKKGATEPDSRTQAGSASLRGQLGHRTGNRLIKENDSDFPEPGSNPEHSGEQKGSESETEPREATETQESGERQKRNQGERREDPLAS